MSVIINGDTGITTPAETVQGALTTTGNTILGNASTDTLNVGNGGLVKDASGNVGIGTASPAQKLDIASKVQIDTANSYGKIKIARATDSGVSALYIQGADNAGTGNDLSLVNTGGGCAAINITGGDLRFYASSNTTERMRIDSSGNLLVGTTSSTGGIVESKSTNAGGECYRAWNSATTGTRYFHYFGLGATFTNVGAITSTGSVTVFATTSDYRLKEDVTPMTGALATIAKLKPCNYKWKVDGSDGQGFIAHEIQEVLPDCVVGEKDAVDDKGNPEHQMIDTSFLVATLTAAIQELKAIVDAQAVRIAALSA